MVSTDTECLVMLKTNPFSVDDKVTPIWNVMGVIPGHIKDEVVVVGNHRDGMDISEYEWLRS